MLMINLSMSVWIFYGLIVAIMLIQLANFTKNCLVTKQYIPEERVATLFVPNYKTLASDGNHQVSSLALEQLKIPIKLF